MSGGTLLLISGTFSDFRKGELGRKGEPIFERGNQKVDARSYLFQGKSKSSSKKASKGEFDWSSERVDILKSINDLMQLEIQRLWNPPIVEEQFTGYVV